MSHVDNFGLTFLTCVIQIPKIYLVRKILHVISTSGNFISMTFNVRVDQ